MPDEPRDPKTGKPIPPLGAVMMDLETVRTRQGEKDFPAALQIVENERGQRTGHEKQGHKYDSKYRDLKLKEGSIREVRNPDGTTTQYAEYVPDD